VFPMSTSMSRSRYERICTVRMNREHDPEMSSSGRAQAIELPPDIRRQELEIELMFRRLVQSANNTSLYSAHGCSNIALDQEVTVWVLLVVLVFICVVGTILFWLKAS